MSKKQSFGMVFAAEFRRIALRPRALVAMGIFAALAVLVAFGVVAASQFAAANVDAETLAQSGQVGLTSLGLPYSIVCFLFCIFTATSSAHDYVDGASAATLVLVPSRGRLLGARVLVWAIMGFLQMFVPGLILAIMFMSDLGGTVPALMSALLYSCAVCLYGLIVFGIATIVRRGAFAVVIYVLIDLVAPLALPMTSGIPVVGDAITEVSHYLPSAVFTRLVSLELFNTDMVAWGIALAVSLAWVALLLVLGRVSFNRYAGESA